MEFCLLITCHTFREKKKHFEGSVLELVKICLDRPKTKQKIEPDHSDPWVFHHTLAGGSLTFSVDDKQTHLTAQRQRGDRRS